MPIGTPTLKDQLGSTANATSYSTGSFTADAGGLLIVFFALTDVDDPGTMNISTTLSGGTWTEQFNQPWNTVAIPTKRTKCWTGVGFTGTGTVTVSGMPDNCQGCLSCVIQVPSGWDTASPIVQAPTATDEVSANTQTTTFAAYSGAGNLAVSFFVKAGTDAFTSEAGWTAQADFSYATPDQHGRLQWQENATDTTSTMTWTTNAQSASGGVEVREAVAAVLVPRNPAINHQNPAFV